MTAWYGCKPDEDKSGPHLDTTGVEVPDYASLFEWFPPVMNQSASGSCTAHGTLNAARYYIRRSAGVDQDFDLSRLQLYWDSRALEGTTDKDEGAQIANVVKTLAEKGVGHESLWPFNLTKLFTPPPPEIYTDANNYKAVIFNRVKPDAQSVRQAITLGHPVIAGLQIFEGFESAETAATGFVPMPLRGEVFISGHCITFGGFDPTHIIARNQWGADWGAGGNCYFEDAYLTEFGSDFWSLDYFT